MKRTFAGVVSKTFYNPKKDFVIFGLAIVIIFGIAYAAKNIDFSSHEWSAPKQSDWIYEEAHYLNSETGEKLSVEEFNAVMGDLTADGVIEKPVEPYNYMDSYVECVDGYQIAGMPETTITTDEYNTYMAEYNDLMKQYENDLNNYNVAVKAMQSKLNGVYEYVEEGYYLKSDVTRRTTVDMYNEYYNQ